MRDEQEVDVPSKLSERFCFAKEWKIPLSINAATLLIRCFGRAKMLEEAISVYKELDPDSRNTMGNAIRPDTFYMNLLMNEMKEKKVKPNVVTFGILIKHLCKCYRVDEALQVFEQMGGSETDGVLVKSFFLPSQLKGRREIGSMYLEEEK
ncbi:hypothetical protein P3S68_008008 [Capsicum galapagoense]